MRRTFFDALGAVALATTVVMAMPAVLPALAVGAVAVFMFTDGAGTLVDGLVKYKAPLPKAFRMVPAPE